MKPTMPERLWRPASEAEAVAAKTVFIEWLRAAHGLALAGPSALAVWRRDAPDAFAAAICEFAGLLPDHGDALSPLPLPEGVGGRGGATFAPNCRPLPQPPPTRGGGFPWLAQSLCETLLRGHGDRAALIVFAADGSPDRWSRSDLLAAGPLPEPVANMLEALTAADLPALAASHLLDAGTAPDDCIAWAGDPTEPWPLGAWIVGASVMLGRDRADAVRAAPNWRG